MTVKQKQNLLAYLGYYVGEVDGIWGTLSETAMNAFRADFKELDVPNMPENAPEKALKHAVAYDMFKTEPVKDETGTFWDEIEYFDRSEFKCKCGGKYCDGFPAEPREDMVRIADNARRHFGRPAYVVSGLRDPIHNRNEKGVDSSQHIYGEACDLKIEGVSAADLLSYIQSQPGVRYAYAINGTNVHFDVPKGDR